MRKKAGFTLLEILVVMIIISIVAGIAALTLNVNQHDRYQTLAKQLANAITLAEQEAMLRSATIGLQINSHAYQFFIFTRNEKSGKNKWMPLNLHWSNQHVLPDDTKIQLQILNVADTVTDEPQLIITPDNNLAPFVILIGKQHETPYYRVIGKGNGEVTSEQMPTE